MDFEKYKYYYEKITKIVRKVKSLDTIGNDFITLCAPLL